MSSNERALAPMHSILWPRKTATVTMRPQDTTQGLSNHSETPEILLLGAKPDSSAVFLCILLGFPDGCPRSVVLEGALVDKDDRDQQGTA